MTDFRARGTIMGPAGLTAVFGMGTGVAPPVWSPGMRPPGRSGPGGRVVNRCPQASRVARSQVSWRSADPSPESRAGIVLDSDLRGFDPPSGPSVPRLAWRGGGSGWSSRSAVRTGRLRRSPAVHSRPIDLVVFQEPSQRLLHGSLVSEGASRLDAFSAYPVPTWLPGDAPSGTAGTPEVGPPQSSRTRGDAPQASYAHGR